MLENLFYFNFKQILMLILTKVRLNKGLKSLTGKVSRRKKIIFSFKTENKKSIGFSVVKI